MRLRFCFVLFSFFLCSMMAKQGFTAPPDVYYIPFIAINNEVEETIIQQTNNLIVEELKNSESFSVKKGSAGPKKEKPVTKSSVTNSDYLSALTLVKKGKDYLEQGQFGKAISTLKESVIQIENYIKFLETIDPIADAYLYMSIAFFQQGMSVNGEEFLSKYVSLQPNMVTLKGDYPPAFTRVYRQIRNRVLKNRRSQIEVTGTESGAPVWFDGKIVGQSPVVLNRAVLGAHYIRVIGSDGEIFAQKLNLEPGTNARVEFAFKASADMPMGSITDGIVSNTIDRAVMKMIINRGQGSEYVLVGGVGKTRTSYEVFPVLVKVSDATYMKFKKVTFDLDLLSASIEVFNLTEEMKKSVEKFKGKKQSTSILLRESSDPSNSTKGFAVSQVNVGPEMVSGQERKPLAGAGFSGNQSVVNDNVPEPPKGDIPGDEEETPAAKTTEKTEQQAQFDQLDEGDELSGKKLSQEKSLSEENIVVPKDEQTASSDSDKGFSDNKWLWYGSAIVGGVVVVGVVTYLILQPGDSGEKVITIGASW